MGELSKVWGDIHPSIANLYGLPLYVFLLVVALTLVFLIGYAIKGTQIWWQLTSTLRAIRVFRQAGSAPNPKELASTFRRQPLKHLWVEYSDTLHELRKAGSGETALTEFRATVPAETMFTKDVLVDGRLFDEFTRHLPGVLTGLGIVGTFAGLLNGLEKFKIDPEEIQNTVNGLGPLLEGVQHAFVASGSAIACAMLVVFVSRFTLAYFYRLVEQLTNGIDSLYRTGAGEEYLARLVKSSEQNAASASQLQDALVKDLRTILTNLTDRQIEAQDTSVRQLGEVIGTTISTAIAEPMQRIGEVVENTSRGNGEQVNSMLETLLTGFMAKLEDTFGGQMRGINEQMQKSMDVMTAVQTSLQGLLADIKSSNEHATAQMSGTLEAAMNATANNQQLLTEQMRTFVQDFRNSVAEEQNKSRGAMNEAVMQVLSEVATAVDRLENVRKASASEESERNQRLTTQTNQMVDDLSTQVASLLDASSEQLDRTQRSIDALENVSLRAIDSMNQGALNMESAARRFETAGAAVSDAFERSAQLTKTLASTSSSLQTVATAVQRGFEQYDATRKTVDTQVIALMGLIESVKKEAGVSRELIDSIKISAEAMRQSEADARAHLDLVNDALVKAFNDFGTALLNQVKSTITETDRHLANGTSNLTAVVQELQGVVQRMRKT